MSLRAGQRRALDQIERALAVDYPGLGRQFAHFALLTSHEPMPGTERVSAWPRRIRPGLVVALVLALVTGGLLAVSLVLPSPRACPPGAVTPVVAAQLQSVPTEAQPTCVAPRERTSGTTP
jgi:hypothetical protein